MVQVRCSMCRRRVPAGAPLRREYHTTRWITVLLLAAVLAAAQGPSPAEASTEKKAVVKGPTESRQPSPGAGRLDTDRAIALARESRDDHWGPCLSADLRTRPHAAVIDGLMGEIIRAKPGGVAPRIIGWKAQRLSGSSYLVSYTYHSPGRGTCGWYWEVDTGNASVVAVNGNLELMKRHHLQIPPALEAKLVKAIVKCLRENGTEVPKLTGKPSEDLARLTKAEPGVAEDYALNCMSSSGVTREQVAKPTASAAEVVTIGDPGTEEAVAGLMLGNTIEYARKLWGAEAERSGEEGTATRYTWYLRPKLYLFVNTDGLDTVQSVLLNYQGRGAGVMTAGKVVLGQDGLPELERKLGTDYEVCKSWWGAEEVYILDVLYRTGPEASLALSFGFDLTAADRASPPKGYEAWLQSIEVATDKGNKREIKRLLGKRPTTMVELK